MLKRAYRREKTGNISIFTGTNSTRIMFIFFFKKVTIPTKVSQPVTHNICNTQYISAMTLLLVAHTHLHCAFVSIVRINNIIMCRRVVVRVYFSTDDSCTECFWWRSTWQLIDFPILGRRSLLNPRKPRSGYIGTYNRYNLHINTIPIRCRLTRNIVTRSVRRVYVRLTRNVHRSVLI